MNILFNEKLTAVTWYEAQRPDFTGCLPKGGMRTCVAFMMIGFYNGDSRGRLVQSAYLTILGS